MKPKRLLTLVSAVLVAGLAVVAALQTVLEVMCTATASGNWNTTGTWSCGHVPLGTEDVTLTGGTVTLNTTGVALTVLLNNGAALSFSGTNSLTVTSDVSVDKNNNNSTSSISVGSGTLSARNLTISSGASDKASSFAIGTGTVTLSAGALVLLRRRA